MKLGYGTYAMQTENILDALPRLRDMGYEALEINTGDDWHTAPHKLDTAARETLAKTIEDLGFESPVTMALMPICTQGDGRPAILEKFDAACILASDLAFGDSPGIIVSTLGGLNGAWDDVKHTYCDQLVELGDRAAKHNVILATEPHAGHPLDTPQKVDWLMRQTDHDNVKVNFDMSHFHVDGIDLQPSVDLCAPYTVSTHIKDGHRVNGQVRYLLPGEGDFDLVAYFKTVAAAGIAVPITVEVTAQIWKQPDYDPWPVAEQCFKALDKARREAGVA